MQENYISSLSGYKTDANICSKLSDGRTNTECRKGAAV